MNMVTFSMFSEALSPNAKRLLKATMNKPVEEYVNGDYELYLIYNSMMDIYQLALQRSGKDFTDVNQQFEKGSSLGEYDKAAFTAKVESWIRKYGDLVFMSHDVRRNPIYCRFLKSMGLKADIVNGVGVVTLKS